MTANPEAAMPREAADPRPDSSAVAQSKPRFTLFIATACGLGYLPKAPGTWGSLGGLLLVVMPLWAVLGIAIGPANLWKLLTHDGAFFVPGGVPSSSVDRLLILHCMIALALAAIGTWSAGRAASFWNVKDPQWVVIDEVSGQHLAILLGCGVPIWWKPVDTFWTNFPPLGAVSFHATLNWKYLLLGFILFRAIDIWKPFPARQAESLPGGWGIMADDWVAGIYAAVGLWIARAAGL
jgi:phosphatidylglycerophosphatase A